MAERGLSQVASMPPFRSDRFERLDQRCIAEGGVRKLGELVYTYHTNGIEGLTGHDMAGIGLAIQGLGDHLESIREKDEAAARRGR